MNERPPSCLFCDIARGEAQAARVLETGPVVAFLDHRPLFPRHCLVGAGALVTEGKTFPERSLILGAPARVARTLTDEEVAALEHSAESYSARATHYRKALKAL